MRRLLVTAVSLSLGLAGTAGSAVAQDKNVEGISTNADGSYVTSTAGLNPTANGEGGTIIYGDINTGPGYTVIGPPSVVNTEPAPELALVAAPEPAPVTATDTTTTGTTETAVADTAVATETDLDADNYPDALEWDLGLDPNNADTDADGVADGDELNIYGTEPTVLDSDGDGIADGEELFGIQTDPLVWDDFSVETTEAVAQEAPAEVSEFSQEPAIAEAPEAMAQGTTEVLTATDGDAAAMGPGNASAAPGTVTRPGASVLGPDGAYNVTEVAPANVSVSGDTEVLAPPAAPASTVAGCGSYGSWYDAQVAYEAAGGTSADPAVVAAFDPDYDGIACEEGM